MDNLSGLKTWMRYCGKWRILAPVADTVALLFAVLVAYALRFNFEIPDPHLQNALYIIPIVVCCEMLSLLLNGCFRLVWHYCSIADVPRFAGAISLSTLFFLIFRLIAPPSLAPLVIPISVTLINAVLSFLALVMMRVISRMIFERISGHGNVMSKTVVIAGVNAAGNALAYLLRHDFNATRKIAGFIDNKSARVGGLIQGLPILGTTSDATNIMQQTGADELIIADTELSRENLRTLFNATEKTNARLLFAPDYSSVLDGVGKRNTLREAEISDLLRRPEIKPEKNSALKTLLQGRRVMITGAGGSIGSEIARQTLTVCADEIVLVERCENALFNINRALTTTHTENTQIFPCVADVTNKQRMRNIFEHYKPEIVIHAAAHKHVPMMELNVCEAVYNNIFGTHIVAELAVEYGVKRFVLLSTDKAVNPSSAMGATKKIAEIIISSFNNVVDCAFSAVRFGNVLGASGSVVPIFREQIEKGGPVTVTHPEMTRYFMTIPEAVYLSLQAASMAQGNDIFILDMGEPVKISCLAKEMIRLTGHRPNRDIAIEFTGIRPGEKLFEELVTPSEKMMKTEIPQISKIRMNNYPREVVEKMLLELRELCMHGDEAQMRDLLMHLATKDGF